ncbi:MAG TPA: hypothetical protein VM580_20380, partial [Labilithrix sp.]|nr:hypothetical protein [Labilithrix sp.]
ASVGVATVSYAVLTACGKDNVPTTGNLPAPPPPTVSPVTGNLPAPPPPEDAALPEAVDAAPEAGTVMDASATVVPHRPPTSGNLPAPPPRDLPTARPKNTGK